MSHLIERKEKNCLNCNAQLEGRYCPICGQENVETQESFFHLINHFFQDITHFDNKFFNTLRYLVFRPGFLPHEYVCGKRANYLNPVRMYVFTSGLFFIIFFNVINPSSDIKINPDNSISQVVNKLEDKIASNKKKLKSTTDSIKIKELNNLINKISKQVDSLKKDTTLAGRYRLENKITNPVFSFTSDSAGSLKVYDSIQLLLPIDKQDGFLRRNVIRKTYQINEKYKNDLDRFKEKLFEKFFHSFPQIFFLSLPLLAVLLQLLYIRHKKIFYVNHLIFTIHFYIFSFIAMLAVFSINKLENATGWGALGYLIAIVNFSQFYYFYKSMRNFYGQKRAKTIFKFLLLLFSFFIVLMVLFAAFFFLSIFQL